MEMSSFTYLKIVHLNSQQIGRLNQLHWIIPAKKRRWVKTLEIVTGPCESML